MGDLLTHRIDGDGEPLLLLNGGLMTIPSWEPIVEKLLPRYRVIRCDFRGQLLSPGSDSESLDDHVRDVVRLLDEPGMGRPHVLGTSFGGEVALLLAARHPGRVRSLVVLTSTDRLTEEMMTEAHELVELAREAASGGDGGDVFRAIAKNTFSDRWLARQPRDFIEQRAAQIAQLPSHYFEGLVGLMSALESLDLADELERISVPALIIGAELDRVFPVERSRALAAAIPRAELTILEGSGHGAIVEMPDRVVAELMEFHDRLKEE